MQNAILGKGGAAALLTVISARLGILFPVMGILFLAMFMDFVTAWSAAKLTDVPISSKICSRGIIKKVLYLICVGCGLAVDLLVILVAEHIGMDGIYKPTFGLLVAIWLILNELVSILENLKKADAPLPGFLLKIVHALKIGVEKKGDALASATKKGEDDNVSETDSANQ